MIVEITESTYYFGLKEWMKDFASGTAVRPSSSHSDYIIITIFIYVINADRRTVYR